MHTELKGRQPGPGCSVSFTREEMSCQVVIILRQETHKLISFFLFFMFHIAEFISLLLEKKKKSPLKILSKNSNLFQVNSGEKNFAQASAEWYSQSMSQRDAGARSQQAHLSCSFFTPGTMLSLQGGQFDRLQGAYGGSE